MRLPTRSVALAALLLAPLAAHAAEWPQYHADALHTGVVATDFAVPKERWWSRSTGAPIEGGPVASDGRVFVGSTDGKLYAFDAIAGSPLWTFDAKDPITSTPAHSGGILYVVTNGGKLFAVDAVTGKQRPSAGHGDPDPGRTRTSPAIHEGRLYLGTEEGTVVAYNLYTLTKDWTYRPSDEKFVERDSLTFDESGDNVIRAPCENRFSNAPVRSSPAVFHDTVYFGSDAHALFAVDEFGLGGQSVGRTKIVWDDDDAPNDFLCPAKLPTAWPLDPKPLVPETGDVIRAAPVIDTKFNLVIIASYDNTVRAYDATTGKAQWVFCLEDLGHPGVCTAEGQEQARVIGAPAVWDGKVYFGTLKGYFYGLESYGAPGAVQVQPLWDEPFHAHDAIWTSPAVSNGLVAFGADDETVYVLDALNGTLRWSSRAGGDVRAPPAIWSGESLGTVIKGGVLFAASADGILYAFGGDKPPLADLAVINIIYPIERWTVGANVDLGVTIANGGPVPSPATELKVFVDGTLVGTQPVAPLGPGINVTLRQTWKVTASNHTLSAIVDPAGLSREFDRGNNELRISTQVARATAAPPPAPPGGVPPTGQAGGEPKAALPGVGIVAVLGVLACAAVLMRRRS